MVNQMLQNKKTSFYFKKNEQVRSKNSKRTEFKEKLQYKRKLKYLTNQMLQK